MLIAVAVPLLVSSTGDNERLGRIFVFVVVVYTGLFGQIIAICLLSLYQKTMVILPPRGLDLSA